MANETKRQKIARQRKERRTQLGSLGKALVKAGVEVSQKDLSKAFPSGEQGKARLMRDLQRKARSRESR